MGVGTTFTADLQEGQWLKVSSDSNGSWSKIETIESDTILYLAGNYNGPSASGVVALGMTFGQEIVGSNTEYTLNRSNGQIELVTPLVAGDNLTAGSINTRAFSDSTTGPFDFASLGASSSLQVRVDGGLGGTVTSGDNSAPFNNFVASNLAGYGNDFFLGYRIDFTNGANAGEHDFVTLYDSSNGQIITATGFSFPIAASDTFVLSQSLTFVHATDFADPAAVPASELVTVINSQLNGATAEERSDGSIRLRSNNLDDGQIQVLSGSASTANAVLNLDNLLKTNEKSNLAYVVSQNSDRDGLTNYPGYTLSPTQNIVILLDNDSTNKTFAVPMRFEAVLDVGSISAPVSSDLASRYPEDDYFKDFWLYYDKDGAAGSFLGVVNTYNGTTGGISSAKIYPNTASPTNPDPGDTFYLVPRTAENLALLMNDLNISTFSTSGSFELLGSTGDYFQISTNLPGTDGKVLISGGTANSIGIAIQGPNTGSAATNDVFTNSIAGLSKGMPVKLTQDFAPDEIVYIDDIQNDTAPFIVSLADVFGNPIDASGLTVNVNAALFDVNGLNLPTDQLEGTDGYKFYSSLIQLAQLTIDGLDSDQSNFPGIAAAGTQFEVIPPVVTQLQLTINITPIDGVSLASVSNDVASAVLEYVNSREVGEDVILSEIIAAAQGVNGVFDAEIENLTENITISDAELARLSDDNLTIG
jgi:hypothetical protein